MIGKGLTPGCSRLRGTHRWAQSNNSAVVPSADASLYELLELYKGPDAEGERPSIRERNVANFKQQFSSSVKHSMWHSMIFHVFSMFFFDGLKSKTRKPGSRSACQDSGDLGNLGLRVDDFVCKSGNHIDEEVVPASCVKRA